MKNVYVSIKIALIFFVILCDQASFGQRIVLKGEISPNELRSLLEDKYSETISAIQHLARGISYPGAVAAAYIADSHIGTAVDTLIGMGEIDLDKVENDIEKAISNALTSIFKTTIAKARASKKHEVSHALFAISPWNKKIVWNRAKTHVLMVTWVPGAYKTPYINALISQKPMTIQWDAWVTAVPELKEFAQKYLASRISPKFKLTDRIEQYLGLIPTKPPYARTQDKYFVEMWVRLEDLFRPCVDAQVIDEECVIDPYEEDLASLPPAFRDMSKLIPMTAEHKIWFEHEKKNKYSGEWAMPWTRFGYTYDWGALKQMDQAKLTVQGASEYLIKKGSNVIIKGVTPTNDYPNLNN
jgi:hypothetical protein